MAYIKMRNNRYNGTSYDVLHYETDSKVVRVMNGNTDLGNLEELLVKGKRENGKAITSIKVTGAYIIRNMTGLPTGLTNTSDLILLVVATGDTVGTPTMTLYQIIGRDGSIYSKTLVGATDSGWSTGGTGLQSTISTINQRIGNVSNLQTNSKVLVGAVNEVRSNLNSLAIQVNTTTENLNTHNHDGRYVNTSGNASLMATDLYVTQGKGLSIRRSNGGLANLISSNSAGGVEIGNVNSTLNLYGSQSLLHNGKKVWSEVNDGSGSGLDADLLDGLEASAFARKSTANTFTQLQTMSAGIDLSNTSIRWGTGRLSFTGTAVNLTHGTRNLMSVTNTGHTTVPTMDLQGDFANGTESKLLFKLASGDKGIGFVRSNGNKNLRMYNYTSGSTVFTVAENDNVLQLQREVQIQGRKLFLQGSTPTGNIPVGSIWIY